jgi:hypothetical protein
VTTWTTPRTWADNDLVDAADLNEQLRDNLEWVKAVVDNSGSYECDEASDYTTSSTSFVPVDNTNLTLTITTNGGDVLIGFYGAVKGTANNQRIYFDIELDSTSYLIGDDGAFSPLVITGYIGPFPVSFVHLARDLEAGEHTFELHWKTNGGTATLYAGAGTNLCDFHPQFWVQEV